jgi:hypothetical protein
MEFAATFAAPVDVPAEEPGEVIAHPMSPHAVYLLGAAFRAKVGRYGTIH